MRNESLKSPAIALVLFMAVLAFYTVTLQPSLAWGDGIRLQREAITGESFILTELVDVEFAPDPFPFAKLGVAAWDHPLYVILGHTLVKAFPAASNLWLVNFLSAVFGAGSVVLLFLFLRTNTHSIVASSFASLALAVSHTFWWNAVTPEVYTLFAFLLMLTIYLFDWFERTGNFLALLAAVFVLGLNASNHLLALLALPAAILYLGMSRWMRFRILNENVASSPNRFFISWQQLLLLLLAFLAGFSPYLIQLIRMLRTFPLSEVLGPAIGATFLSGSLATSPRLLVQSVQNYGLFLAYQYGPVGLLIGIYGWITGFSHFKSLWRKAFSLYVVYGAFGIFYRVSDQFAFFLAAHIFWSMAIGMGVARLESSLLIIRRWTLTAGLALLILVMPMAYDFAPGLLRSFGIDDDAFGIPEIGTGVRDGLNYYLNPNRRGDETAYDFGQQVMNSLPPDSVVLAEWYVDTDEYFVLSYFAAVEGSRPDLEIVGWPREDPFEFDTTLALERIEADIDVRPIFLASLSEEYYGISELNKTYCIIPEHNLYRLYRRQEAEQDCPATAKR